MNKLALSTKTVRQRSGHLHIFRLVENGLACPASLEVIGVLPWYKRYREIAIFNRCVSAETSPILCILRKNREKVGKAKKVCFRFQKNMLSSSFFSLKSQA
jgi:hypothetical protein